MSGVFNPDEQQHVEATDDKALADKHGLTEWDEGRGQWVKPPQTSDVGTRDSGASGPPEEKPAPAKATSSAKSAAKKSADEDKDHPTL